MRLHETCTTDQAAPQFDHEWQRRAFGLALALAEFGHYDWEDLQQNLIQSIGEWEGAPGAGRGDWQYYPPLGGRAGEGRCRPSTSHRAGRQR
jgi:nitrile hydratase accessory protein